MLDATPARSISASACTANRLHAWRPTRQDAAYPRASTCDGKVALQPRLTHYGWAQRFL